MSPSAAWLRRLLLPLLAGSLHAAEFHVAPEGSDAGDGSAAHPFATPHRAREVVRNWLQTNSGEVRVILHDGDFDLRTPLVLESADGGGTNKSVLWTAAPGAKPRMRGGVTLPAPAPLADDTLRARLPEAVRSRALTIDLKAAGITNLAPLELGGFSSGRGFRTHPVCELFADGSPLPLAASSNTYDIAHILGATTNASHGRKGCKEGHFAVSNAPLAAWAAEPDLWLHGYWFWDWAENYEKVQAIDAATGEIRLAPPCSTYGFTTKQPFRAVNALCELDEAGEWWIDRPGMRVVLLPPEGGVKTCELSLANGPLLRLRNVARTGFTGLTFELSAGDGVRVEGGREVVFAGCTVRNCGGDGLILDGGWNHRVRSCDFEHFGRGALIVRGGDRRTLKPGGHEVVNCIVRELSRIDRTYTPAVLVDGVGHRIANNQFSRIPSSALRIGGNDHTIELNHIFEVVLESDDQGAVDMWGDPTIRGVRFERNVFHDVGSSWNGGGGAKLGQAAIRFDDAISGMRVAGNVFLRCGAGGHGFGAIQIHGGRDNTVLSNLFVDCSAVLSQSAWDDKRWQEFIAPRLDETKYNAALYAQRYPEFANVRGEANVNTLRNNAAVSCAKLTHRTHKRMIVEGNRVETNALPLAELAKGLPDAATALEKAGLFADSFRPAIADPRPARRAP